MSDFVARLQRLEERLPAILKDKAQMMGFQLKAYTMGHIDPQSTTGRYDAASGEIRKTGFSSRPRIGLLSGGIARALDPGGKLRSSSAQAANVWNVDASEKGLFVNYGINPKAVPYALIHEEGGKVPVTEKMRRYFWAKSLSASDAQEARTYRMLALSATMKLKSGGSFVFPARPFFQPGMKDFQQKGLPGITRLTLKEMVHAMSG